MREWADTPNDRAPIKDREQVADHLYSAPYLPRTRPDHLPFQTFSIDCRDFLQKMLGGAVLTDKVALPVVTFELAHSRFPRASKAHKSVHRSSPRPSDCLAGFLIGRAMSIRRQGAGAAQVNISGGQISGFLTTTRV